MFSYLLNRKIKQIYQHLQNSYLFIFRNLNYIAFHKIKIKQLILFFHYFHQLFQVHKCIKNCLNLYIKINVYVLL